MYSPEEIENFEMLSSYLRTTHDQLSKFAHGYRAIIDFKDLSSLNNLPKDSTQITVFQRFYIPKKNKKLGYRIVYKSTRQFTRDIHKVLKFNINKIYIPHSTAHGFVHGRNTRSNAIVHLGKKYLLSLDILNFFESINKQCVYEAFLNLGFIDNIALDLASICTLNDKLVQGFPTSPLIANIVCLNMDNEIEKLCTKYGASYTRYADDISISSNGLLPEISEIENILKSFQFDINSLKTKKFIKGQNQYVTGLSISDSSYPRVPKAVKNRLRQELYYINKYGYHSHICKIHKFDENKVSSSDTRSLVRKTENRLKGMLAYIHSIEPEFAKKCYDIFNEIQKVEYAELIKLMAEKGIKFKL